MSSGQRIRMMVGGLAGFLLCWFGCEQVGSAIEEIGQPGYHAGEPYDWVSTVPGVALLLFAAWLGTRVAAHLEKSDPLGTAYALPEPTGAGRNHQALFFPLIGGILLMAGCAISNIETLYASVIGVAVVYLLCLRLGRRRSLGWLMAGGVVAGMLAPHGIWRAGQRAIPPAMIVAAAGISALQALGPALLATVFDRFRAAEPPAAGSP